MLRNRLWPPYEVHLFDRMPTQSSYELITWQLSWTRRPGEEDLLEVKGKVTKVTFVDTFVGGNLVWVFAILKLLIYWKFTTWQGTVSHQEGGEEVRRYSRREL